jgi:hypothetical protein
LPTRLVAALPVDHGVTLHRRDLARVDAQAEDLRPLRQRHVPHDAGEDGKAGLARLGGAAQADAGHLGLVGKEALLEDEVVGRELLLEADGRRRLGAEGEGAEEKEKDGSG